MLTNSQVRLRGKFTPRLREQSRTQVVRDARFKRALTSSSDQIAITDIAGDKEVFVVHSGLSFDARLASLRSSRAC